MSLPPPEAPSAGRAGAAATAPADRRALAGLLGGAAVVMLGLALLPPYAGDMAHYKMWTRTVTLEGIHNAYNGVWPDTYAVYPPVTLAVYWMVGQVYRLLVDPAFALAPALASPLLTYLLKAPGIGFHLLTGLALFRCAAPAGPRTALAATAAYLFNPAALFDLCYWGQPDSVYGLFVLLAVAGTAAGPLTLGWGALAAAAFAKPQAWALGPLLGAAGLLLHRPAQWGRGAVVAALICAVVVAPYAVGGRLPQLATLPHVTGEVQPAVSANAHNLWWLVTLGRGLHVTDTYPPGMPPPAVTTRTIGYALWGAATLLALAAVARSRRRDTLLEAAAFAGFAFVMLATRVHENHAFMVLPLGALAAVYRPALWRLWAGISVLLLINMAAHDPALMALAGVADNAPEQRLFTLGNAAFGMVLLTIWTARLLAEVRSARLNVAPAPVADPGAALSAQP